MLREFGGQKECTKGGALFLFVDNRLKFVLAKFGG